MVTGLFSPCYGCKDRHDLCHSECEDYLTFRKKKDEENARRREDSDIGHALWKLHLHGAMSRTQKRSNH
jgi:hypothetical protein